MSTPLEFSSAIRALMTVLDESVPGMIIGGVAVMAHGFPRATVDIDATVWASFDELGPLVGRLKRAGIEPRISGAIEFAKTNHVLLMEHRDSKIPIDISLAVLPFEKEAIAHRRLVELGGLHLAIPRIDDLLVYKMVASRPQDLRDVEELLLRHVDTVDLARTRRLVAEFSAVLERPEMLTIFDRLVALARRCGKT